MQPAHPHLAERRADPRLPLQVPVELAGDERAGPTRTVDMSLGGACLSGQGVARLKIGERLRLALRLPEGGTTVETWAEVRWAAQGRVGVRFARAARTAIAGFIAAAVGLAAPSALADASVPTFDPNADQVLDGYDGSERPDEQQIMSAFEQSYEHIDRCVAKARRGDDDVVEGDADLQILLNPKGPRPLGVNANVSGPHTKNRKLVECLRRAAAKAPYPTYDGPPVVVEMSFELDPGYDVVEEE